MAKTFHGLYQVSSVSTNRTRYNNITGRSGENATQSNRQVPVYSAGTFSDYKINVFSNTLDVNAVQALQIDGSDGNNTITVTASTTGYFTVTANDSVTSGQKVNYQYTVAAGTGSAQFRPSISFAATSDSAQLFMNTSGSYTPDDGSSIYLSLSDGNFDDPNEGRFGFKFKTGGTLRNGSWMVGSNTRVVDTLAHIRVDDTDGNTTINATASTTGLFQDTTNTDIISDGNVVNWSIDSTTDTPNLSGTFMAIEFITTDSTFQILGGTNGTATIATGLTRYMVPGGAASSTDATALNSQNKVGFAFTASNLEINIIANAATTAGTFDFYHNGSASALTTSITALTTGLYVDNTNTVSVADGDTLNFEIISGATGGYTLGTYGLKGTISSGSSIKTVNGLAFASVKAFNGLAIASVKNINGLA